jgi:hypothetical protein
MLQVTEKLVLLLLADYHNTHAKRAWPSVPLLAEEALLGERQLQRILRTLEEKKVIQTHQGNGRGNYSIYEFLGLERVTSGPPLLNGKDDISGQKGRHLEAKGRHLEPRNKEELQNLKATTTPVFAFPFQKPTLEEVTAYCKERQNQVDPQLWIDHYSSNGWKVGRNPMKDWRAAVRTWEKNWNGHRDKNAPPPRIKYLTEIPCD